jgi:hypothetical protein
LFDVSAVHGHVEVGPTVFGQLDDLHVTFGAWPLDALDSLPDEAPGAVLEVQLGDWVSSWEIAGGEGDEAIGWRLADALG